MSENKGPALTWPGRAWSPDAAPRAAPLCTPLERVGNGEHRLLWGDALDVATRLHEDGVAGRVDLVYVDPPYASQSDYVLEARLDGPASGRVRRALAYEDTWDRKNGGVGAYLDMLAPRLEAAARLLAPTGTLWVHLDWRAAYLVRVLLDEIMGRERFLNEIVWRRAPNLGRQAASSQFGRTLDTLVAYGGPRAALRPPTRLERIEPKAVRWDDEGRPFTSAPRGDYTDESIERLDAEGRVHRSRAGRVYVKYFLQKDDEGHLCRERRVDALWTDVPPLRHAPPRERTGYPTQKPRALLERIIACASPPGGLVVDLFAGSGTTGEAAHALGRRAILGDRGTVAIATARARLLRAGAGLVLERCGVRGAPPEPRVHARVVEEHHALEIELCEPCEPLAWAVDTAYREDAGFRTAWHSERAPGPRPVHPPRVARVARGEGPLAIRVYADDGAFATIRPVVDRGASKSVLELT